MALLPAGPWLAPGIRLRRLAWAWPLGLLLLVVLALYGQTAAYPFLPYDDAVNITDNPLLQAPAGEALARLWRQPYAGLYIPLTYTAWYGLAQLARTGVGAEGQVLFAAAVFHAANLVLHLWNCAWVLALLRLFLRRPSLALIGVLLYGLHPLQVEAVAWVSGGKDLLLAALAWPAAWAYLRFVQDGRKVHGVVATAAYVLAMLAKPMAVSLPLALLGLVWALPARDGADPLGKVWHQRPTVRRALGLSSLWLMLMLPQVVVTLSAQPSAGTGAASGGELSAPWTLGARLTVAADALGFYLQKIFLPTQLAIDYGRTPELVLASPLRWLSGGTVLGVFLAALWVGRRRALGAAGFFALALLPVLGLVPFDFQRCSTVADRYLYLPLLGVILSAMMLLEAVLGESAQRRSRWGGLRLALVPIAVLALVFATAWRQVGYWRSGSALFAQALAVNPRSVMVLHSYGTALVEAGRLAAGAEQYLRALQVRPNFSPVRYSLGVVREQQGRLEEAFLLFSALSSDLLRWTPAEIRSHPREAAPEMFEAPVRVARQLRRFAAAETALATLQQLFPERWQSDWLEAQVAADQRQAERAEAAYRRALARAPDAAQLHTAYGDFLGERGASAEEQERQYQAAIALQPRYAAAHVNLGTLLAQQRLFAAAEVQFRLALAAEPCLATAHADLGLLLEQTGRASAAAAAYQSALHCDASLAAAEAGLARLAQTNHKEP